MLTKVLLVAAALIGFGLWERLAGVSGSPLLWRGWRAGAAAWRRLGRNLGLFALNLAISPLIVLPITAFAATHALLPRPDVGFWPGLALDLLVLDLWLYGWHRLNHEWPWLWRFHQVHHLDETLDVTSALRFHAGEVALSAAVRGGVILLLGIPFASVVVFEGLVLASAILHHSDARLPPGLERRLQHFLVTPGLHWVHHHARRADTDSNYATILSLWDRLFATRSPSRRFAGMPIGVDGQADRPLLALLTTPLGPAAAERPPSAREFVRVETSGG